VLSWRRREQSVGGSDGGGSDCGEGVVGGEGGGKGLGGMARCSRDSEQGGGGGQPAGRNVRDVGGGEMGGDGRDLEANDAHKMREGWRDGEWKGC
jgi:hypothetical protein